MSCSWTSSSDEDSGVELSSTVTTSKRLKAFDGDGTDRISALPDFILHHVFSFMDMREVVHSSLLSRRWRSLWIFVPVLNFSHSVWIPRNGPRDECMFMRFVDRVLLFRANSNIQKISLSSSYLLKDVCDWIRFAVERHVEEVHLDYPGLYGFFPGFMFTSPIKVFKLRCSQINGPQMRLPRSMYSASQLRSLELYYANLRDEGGGVIISCPVLENLSISYCNHNGIGFLDISAPRLKNLLLENDSKSFNNSCVLQIFSPNLTSLVLKGGKYKGYSLEVLSFIVNAKLKFDEPMDERDLIKVLKCLGNATTLELSGESLKSGDMSDQLLNPFLNLRRLELNGFSAGSYTSPVLGLLRNSPFIETLVFEIDQLCKEKKDWELLFPCIDHLKSIQILGIRGHRRELQFFSFVLKTAVVLEEFTVTTEKRFSEKPKLRQAKFSTKMYSLPRASSKVQILFLI